jgi:hypothetical protein
MQAITLEYSVGLKRVINARGENNRWLGCLFWSRETHVISLTWVEAGYRRENIASRMLELARKIDPEITHNQDLTTDGKAWVKFALPYFATAQIRSQEQTSHGWPRSGLGDGKSYMSPKSHDGLAIRPRR